MIEDFWSLIEPGDASECHHYWGTIDESTGHGIYEGVYAHHIVKADSTQTCANPDCCNPAHLAETAPENIEIQPNGCWYWASSRTFIKVKGKYYRPEKGIFMLLNPDFKIEPRQMLYPTCGDKRCVKHREIKPALTDAQLAEVSESCLPLAERAEALGFSRRSLQSALCRWRKRGRI